MGEVAGPDDCLDGGEAAAAPGRSFAPGPPGISAGSSGTCQRLQGVSTSTRLYAASEVPVKSLILNMS